ncbi:cupredoxin domain-containing protein [Flavivirga eckloniae]|uniref:Uncharacterized protein n=1 Tax=Flavivirga eckloniae TaxID=1803846 RepID=A0A2K9PPV7_9FLAO|nr:hypothetical protein [Flavivirga eckloniae]AUP79101.1 hypothetical protein C1H87_10485 [Flavivirga eckloniae]
MKAPIPNTKTSSIVLLIYLILVSCQFNQSVNKDVTTGAYSRENGIGCDDVVIEINGNTEKRNEFVYGEKVKLTFNNISGLTNVKNKTYPGLSMYIVKNEKDTVLSNPELLNNLDKGIDISPLQLYTYFIATAPKRNNETYKVHVNIWDKKGDGKFSYELPFTLKESELFDIKNNGIECSSVYLQNETLKRPIFDKNISLENSYMLTLDDIKGLKSINGKVFPVFSIDLIDNNGNKILSRPNVLSDFEAISVNPEDSKTKLYTTFSLSNVEINNPYKLIAKVKDKNSSKEIEITAELIIN